MKNFDGPEVNKKIQKPRNEAVNGSDIDIIGICKDININYKEFGIGQIEDKPFDLQKVLDSKKNEVNRVILKIMV